MPSSGASRSRELAQLVASIFPVESSALGGRELPRGSVVAVAMSGGVDSSVAAALAAASGLDTVGVTMRLWGTEEMERGEGGCCSIDAVEDARRVCSRLGIPHYVLNMAEQFRESVVGDFLSQYAQGRTPNPCIRCNEKVKFSELWRRVGAVGATHIASGHYAQVRERSPGWYALHRGADRRKDQSYTLYRTGQAVLAQLVLPLGQLQKATVRALAERLELQVAQKPDSQELCFVGGGDHRAVLEQELAGQFEPGPITDVAGAVLGRHRGLPFYTVGQRQGLGLAVRQPASEPHYVVRVDRARNTLVVGPWRNLLQRVCQVGECVLLDDQPISTVRSGLVQLRAHGQPVAATWRPAPGNCATVRFDEPQAGIAPGQSLVLYDGDRVVAGGEIAPTEEMEFA
ncbi:MAG TPA: tRNA 2-thiouridine(34) synthase MnmA [Candidatus Nanopelagicaceae bacterium]|nr:tRNA 2-thiouridine(34) synthase MnmA [Candidatus Nanopelagicaceae bacterium]